MPPGAALNSSSVTWLPQVAADDPTWGGVLRGMLVLAALWWAWTA